MHTTKGFEILGLWGPTSKRGFAGVGEVKNRPQRLFNQDGPSLPTPYRTR